MDAARFLRELPALFDDFPRSERPRDRRFAPVLEVENLASENVLALLNLAASCLGPDEAYVDTLALAILGLLASRERGYARTAGSVLLIGALIGCGMPIVTGLVERLPLFDVSSNTRLQLYASLSTAVRKADSASA